MGDERTDSYKEHEMTNDSFDSPCTIIYNAGNYRHEFDTSEAYESFMAWVEFELIRKFAGHRIMVMDSTGPYTMRTNDNEYTGAIYHFCGNLFSKYASLYLLSDRTFRYTLD